MHVTTLFPPGCYALADDDSGAAADGAALAGEVVEERVALDGAAALVESQPEFCLGSLIASCSSSFSASRILLRASSSSCGVILNMVR